MWAVDLSVRLPVKALVSRYLTNKLIGLGPLIERNQPFTGPDESGTDHRVLAVLSNCYPRLEGRSSKHYSPFRHSTRSLAATFAFDLHA